MWRKRYLRLRKSFIMFQAIVRQNIEKNNFVNCRNKILLLQSLIRKWLSMILFKRRMFLVIKTQASIRRRTCQNWYFNIRRGFINFQSIVRQLQGSQKYHRTWRRSFKYSLLWQFLAKTTLFKRRKQNKIIKVPQRQYKRCVANRYEKLWMESIDLLRKQAGYTKKIDPSC